MVALAKGAIWGGTEVVGTRILIPLEAAAVEVTESRSKAAGERLGAWASVKAARAVLGAGRSKVLGFRGDGMVAL